MGMYGPVQSAARQAITNEAFAGSLETDARRIVERVVRMPMPAERLTAAKVFAWMTEQGIEHLILLDQEVADIEAVATKEYYGFECKSAGLKLTVLDHHVGDKQFSALSTGNLARKYFEYESGGPPRAARIGVTHWDCDSAISAGIMLGVLPPFWALLGAAVLAADHTAKPNEIADLLQAIEVVPGKGRLVNQFHDAANWKPSMEFSLRNLGLLLQGKALDPEAEAALQARLEAREIWKRRIENRQVHQLRYGTYFAELLGPQTNDPYPEFLKGLLPDAMLILVFHEAPPPHDPGFKQVRAVRGATGAHLSLRDKRIISRGPKGLIPGFGGRDDAGSNLRSGISFAGDALQVAVKIDRRAVRL